jgi:hypothetical protein
MNAALAFNAARRAHWLGYTLFAWAMLFAAVHFYWAVGGRVGIETIGPAVTEFAEDFWFVIIGLWGVGVGCVGLGLFALALVQPWGNAIPHWMRQAVAWGIGTLFALYGGALLVQHGLMLAGVIGIPPGLGATAARWHLLVWDPWWLLGGALLLATAWSTRRDTSTRYF